jgi:hypothetical protein
VRSLVSKATDVISRATVAVLVFLVRLYQAGVRPLLGGGCRFHPSCSQYTVEALRVHGVFRGLGLATWRILRCHPFGGSGYDPVPPAEKRCQEPSPPGRGS